MEEIDKIPYYEEFVAEGLLDFFKGLWQKLIDLVSGEQKVFFRKLEAEDSKNGKIKLLNQRIEELAQRYIDDIMNKDKDPLDLLDSERDLIQLFKIYTKITGKFHKRDVHRKTGLFDRIFLWPDLIKKGVTKEDIEQQYRDKIESIRRRADRKIQKAEEELAYFMKILK